MAEYLTTAHARKDCHHGLLENISLGSGGFGNPARPGHTFPPASPRLLPANELRYGFLVMGCCRAAGLQVERPGGRRAVADCPEH